MNGQACFLMPSTANCLFTSLGEGGELARHFTDNFLSGSSGSGSVTGVGDGFNDLYVFEVGVAEPSIVDIGNDGINWINVATIAGGGGSSIGVFTYGFDIDVSGSDSPIPSRGCGSGMSRPTSTPARPAPTSMRSA
ncbi:MAG: hypothetical protein FJ197_09880 [Gammaproteobacteria bacterium]|nr:hypothetical protein [Gammaproteobacteria bacterium]